MGAPPRRRDRRGRQGTASRHVAVPVGGQALFALTSETREQLTPPDAGRLAVRNLLRGYRPRMPTGQAVAKHLNLPVLTAVQLRAAAVNDDQRRKLGPFVTRMPLWYYVLAEAKHHGGNWLGSVGGTLVAEVLIGLVRRSKSSILSEPSWHPSLPSAAPGTFQLADLLRFAGVLGAKPVTRTYPVKSGDTLQKIAQKQFGDANRWQEIFLRGRPGVGRRSSPSTGRCSTNPDALVPGTMLVLP